MPPTPPRPPRRSSPPFRLHRSTTLHSIADVKRKQVIVGASSPGTQTYIVPALFNVVLGTKFKLVMGYPGTSRMTLAMERHEIQGHVASWYYWKKARPAWFRSGIAVVLAQGTLERSPELPNVPTYAELAATPDQKLMMDFMTYPIRTSYSLAVAPGVPADRVAALRRGLMATLRDPAFLAAATRLQMEIVPSDYQVVQNAMAKLFETRAAQRMWRGELTCMEQSRSCQDIRPSPLSRSRIRRAGPRRIWSDRPTGFILSTRAKSPISTARFAPSKNGKCR
jgi:hypothetical protein